VTHPFDGVTYDERRDGKRLGTQLERVRDLMLDGHWRTLDEIGVYVKGSEAAISARLRDLRKPKFGGYVVDRQNVGGGVWRYRVTRPPSRNPFVKVRR
jgi:hypothetical protein